MSIQPLFVFRISTLYQAVISSTSASPKVLLFVILVTLATAAAPSSGAVLSAANPML
jgi:hypothetical protein